MQISDIEISEILVKASTPQEFLQDLTDSSALASKALSYSELARKCSFSSRSFVRQLVLGQRRISLKSCEKICNGLRLPAQAGAFYRNLVKLQVCNASPAEGLAVKQVVCELQVSRSSLGRYNELVRNTNKAQRATKGDLEASLEEFNGGPDAKLDYQDFEKPFARHTIALWPFVYAALGGKGKSVEEISRKTKIEFLTTIRILDQMKKKGLVRVQLDRYFASAPFLSFGNMGGSEGFTKFYSVLLEQTGQALCGIDSLKNQSLYGAVFSIKKADLGEVAKKFQALLEEFAVGHEAADGDQLVTIQAAFLRR